MKFYAKVRGDAKKGVSQGGARCIEIVLSCEECETGHGPAVTLEFKLDSKGRPLLVIDKHADNVLVRGNY